MLLLDLSHTSLVLRHPLPLPYRNLPQPFSLLPPISTRTSPSPRTVRSRRRLCLEALRVARPFRGLITTFFPTRPLRAHGDVPV